MIPAPRGTGIVSAPVPKKLLTMAGIEDCYTSARGSTGTLGNFGKLTIKNDYFHTIINYYFLFCTYLAKATYAAIAKTYAYLTPDLWKDVPLKKTPYSEFADHLSKCHKVAQNVRADL